MNDILFITKDALAKEYLPIYGNSYWKNKTPNIDELSKKGTVFTRFYTAAPSTVMSFRTMMMSKFPHEQPFSDYSPKEVMENEEDFFSYAKRMGFESHIIWDSSWNHMVLRYGNCYGKETKIHSLNNIKQGVGCHYNHKDALIIDDKKSAKALSIIIDEIKAILSPNKKCFVWIHLPHVINGRICYGGDIDLFDELIGLLRHYFDDDNIFISADHGNMNGHEGKFCYGFDLNTSSIEIPLLTPRISGLSVCSDYVSNVDIKKIIFDRTIAKREFIFSDTAYYAQPKRKIAIINNSGLVYIYDKFKKTEYLFDRENDRFEDVNLLVNTYKDKDRGLKSNIKEYYYSPYWNKIDEIYSNFKKQMTSVWKKAPLIIEIRNKLIYCAKKIVIKFRKKKK